jgi:flagellar hook-length control protein FliK
VVSDESLYISVDNIITVQREVTADLMQELNLTPEEFKEVLNSEDFIKEMTVETEETAVVIPAEEAKAEVTEKETDGTEEFRAILENKESTETITSEKETAGTPAETVKTSEVTREPDRQPEREVEVVLEKVSFESTEVKEATADHKESGSGRHFGAGNDTREAAEGFTPGAVQSNDISNTFMENLTEAVSESTSEFISSYERFQDIMNQVRDQIRISVNQETTTMEMQLNPESLGKVGLHIESKAGNVTAQFFAQDESVRAALETQVAELRKNLEEQGIKVESVEVTLASREFESNFLNDGGNRNGDTPDSEEAERSARLRRINLGAGNAEEIPEEGLTEEEELNRRIMTENGNSVDFMA